MDAEIIKAIVTLGPTTGAVIVVYIFIGYLRDRDTHLRDSLNELKKAMEELPEKLKK